MGPPPLEPPARSPVRKRRRWPAGCCVPPAGTANHVLRAAVHTAGEAATVVALGRRHTGARAHQLCNRPPPRRTLCWCASCGTNDKCPWLVDAGSAPLALCGVVFTLLLERPPVMTTQTSTGWLMAWRPLGRRLGAVRVQQQVAGCAVAQQYQSNCTVATRTCIAHTWHGTV